MICKSGLHNTIHSLRNNKSVITVHTAPLTLSQNVSQFKKAITSLLPGNSPISSSSSLSLPSKASPLEHKTFFVEHTPNND